MRQKPGGDPTTAPAQAVLAVVLQVRRPPAGTAARPFSGAGLPRGARGRRDAGGSIRRQLATKVDVERPPGAARDVERARAPSQPARASRPRLGLVPADVDPELADTAWHVVDDLPGSPSTTPRSCSRRGSGCAASSPTRTSASRSRRRLHALGAARHLRGRARPRRLGDEPQARAPPPRRAARRPARAASGAGGRPAEVYRFRSRRLEITDPFAALRPPA